MTANTGYIKFYRTIKTQPWYHDSEAVHLFVHLLIEAAHEPREALFGGKLIKLKPGQLVTGRNKLAAETGINRSKLERVLQMFEKCGQIEQQMSNVNRCISILNWSKFQKSEQQTSSKRAANEQPASSKRAHNKKKEVRNNNSTPPPAHAHATPDQWATALLLDDLFVERTCLAHKITPDRLTELLQAFTLQKTALQKNHTGYSDFRENFFHWIPKNIQERKLNGNHGKTRNHTSIVAPDIARSVVEELINERR